MTEFRHKGKVIGDLHGKTLIKRGRQVILFRVFDGFGISKDVLDLVNKIVCHYEGKVYTADVEDFWEKGIEYDFAGDKQLVLPRKFWAYQDKDQLSLIK